ncbi:MAG: type III-B CRISPR module RAMP protein Cmr6 [Candidatus Eisenbacteria bacterium]|nr:type III-B CRISPR module RAMP protein Cmr6 [Candidatus Eisenbacteria bacterium]
MSELKETVARRNGLSGVSACESTHPGLWLNRWARKHGDKGEEKRALIGAVIDRIRPPDFYPRAFQRWVASLRGRETYLVPVETIGRVIVGLGADCVLETSIALHHTYGVPVLPGSALKGLARRFCLRRFGSSDQEGKEYRPSGVLKQSKRLQAGQGHDWDFTFYDTLFGHVEGAGCLVFNDAWLVPRASNEAPLIRDVLTVHHRNYYGASENPAPPADWDDPIPVPYLTVAPGVCFLLAIEGPDGWRDRAMEILLLALREEGIGAKTSSGYGRMEETERSGSLLARLEESRIDPEVEDYSNRLEEEVPEQQGRLTLMYRHVKGQEDPDLRKKLSRALLFGLRRRQIEAWKEHPRHAGKYRDLVDWAGLE